ncbi:MAG: pyrroline-5-carboxylate reductase [Candidatus Diapherotrites archaeon]|uniref:Pyrroline-5-carboxylate reductase n=1 Tax=Candidatus Iainarchaeum sp. TaxID=3101447 RepID=A0A939C4X3_9ARCH|nr:pyrroline-5-carboxylate reductase [Candidatus Diapherotrites archaeon]
MIALFGAGRMGYALLYAMLQSEKFSEQGLVVFDKSPERVELVKGNFNVLVAGSAAEAALKADILLLAVKPQDMQQLLGEIKNSAEGKLVVSIAAGLKISFFEKQLPKSRIVRVMPNIACMVQAMAGAYAVGRTVSAKDKSLVSEIFSPAGMIGEVKEEQLDAVTALSGSGPAFFAFFAQELARAAEKNGLEKQAALELVAQTMLGTAKLLQSMDASKLIESVASPGGTTEAGLKKLQQKAAKDALSSAIDAAANKSRELSK